MIMSWVGVTSGLPCAGLSMLLLESMRTRASACASADSGRCTAIWSPSKSALKAVHTSGWIWIGLALDEDRLEGLDAEAVQRGGTVEEHRVLLDDVLEHVPDLRAATLHHPLGRLDVLGERAVDERLHHEGLEQLERHQLGQTALVQLQGRADHDDRTARVVDALAEQVLAEPALLALQHVGERLERAVARAR